MLAKLRVSGRAWPRSGLAAPTGDSENKICSLSGVVSYFVSHKQLIAIITTPGFEPSANGFGFAERAAGLLKMRARAMLLALPSAQG